MADKLIAESVAAVAGAAPCSADLHAVRCDDLLAELDRQYVRFKATQHTAVWGGSWEREHAAQLDLKPLVNEMFDTMIKLLEARSANGPHEPQQPGK